MVGPLAPRVEELLAPSTWRRQFARGVIVGGKYQVERVLGATDVTLTIEATRKDLGQPVTLRVLLPELAARESVASRYLREAKRSASLRSQHAVRVLDVGRLATGEPFIVNERLDGGSLASAGGLSIGRAIELTAQACDVLAEAHARGRTHGELTPRSLFLAERSRGGAIVKVFDFGLAALRAEIERVDGGLTPARVVGGEPLYLAPEQLDPSQGVDARTDVWALGAILYELLSGKAPFVAEGLAQIVRLVAQGTVAPPSSLRRGIPEVLDDVVLRCLQKDPRRRYTDAGELLRELDDVLADLAPTSLVDLPCAEPEDEHDDSETRVSPFVHDHAGPLPEPSPSSVERSALPAVFAPTVGDDITDLIPSLVTGTDPSSRELLVRPHPLSVRDHRERASPWFRAWMVVALMLLAAMLLALFAADR